MLGGVVSALVVGFLLERGDLYAGLAAESYVQDADDEEFWKGLSEEERKKTEEMLAKIKASKNGGESALEATVPPTPAVSAATESTSSTPSDVASTKEAPKVSQPTDMFSDYGD